MIRVKVLYSGLVQGVGFRYTTHRISKKFQITGYVKNLKDGRVEVIAEGNKSELDEFLTMIKDRMLDYIRGVDLKWAESTGKFDSFQIEH